MSAKTERPQMTIMLFLKKCKNYLDLSIKRLFDDKWYCTIVNWKIYEKIMAHGGRVPNVVDFLPLTWICPLYTAQVLSWPTPEVNSLYMSINKLRGNDVGKNKLIKLMTTTDKPNQAVNQWFHHE